MTVAFYFDEHIDPAIADGLRSRGVDVLTVQEDGRIRATDKAVYARARELGRVVFTSDADYIMLARMAARAGATAAGVVILHQGTMSIGEAILELEVIAGASTIDEWQGRVEHLPL